MLVLNNIMAVVGVEAHLLFPKPKAKVKHGGNKGREKPTTPEPKIKSKLLLRNFFLGGRDNDTSRKTGILLVRQGSAIVRRFRPG